MFDKFKNDEGGEMVEERPEGSSNAGTVEVPAESSQIGIGELMGKRAKLEEAIDYVGLMIKNLKEKLQKVSEYIDEENRGITELANKRKQVESEADEVGVIINNLRDKLSGVDKIIDDEGSRVKQVKEARDTLES